MLILHDAAPKILLDFEGLGGDCFRFIPLRERGIRLSSLGLNICVTLLALVPDFTLFLESAWEKVSLRGFSWGQAHERRLLGVVFILS